MGAVRSLGVPSGLRIIPVTCTDDFPFISEITSARVPSRDIRKSLTTRPANHAGVIVTVGTGCPRGTLDGLNATTSVAPLAPGPAVQTQSCGLKDGWLRVVLVVS